VLPRSFAPSLAPSRALRPASPQAGFVTHLLSDGRANGLKSTLR
jgi:hypothetical protein